MMFSNDISIEHLRFFFKFEFICQLIYDVNTIQSVNQFRALTPVQFLFIFLSKALLPYPTLQIKNKNVMK